MMRTESQRRSTFDKHWPTNNPNPKDLAEAGFFYTGVADRTECAFCHGKVKHWRNNEDPFDVHRNQFPSCPFIKGKKSRKQENPKRNPLCDSPIENNSGDLLQIRNPATSIHKLGIDTSQPKNENYRILARRQKSFDGSPNIKFTNKLSEAGFYSIRNEESPDKVACHWCDGVLSEWKDTDEPWTEHAKYYPGCSYVQLTKGKDFIRQVWASLTNDEKNLVSELAYNSCGIDFLKDPIEVTRIINEAIPDVPVMICLHCRSNSIASTCLPCGCFCLCDTCRLKENWPDHCPRCQKPIEGTFKTYLG